MGAVVFEIDCGQTRHTHTYTHKKNPQNSLIGISLTEMTKFTVVMGKKKRKKKKEGNKIDFINYLKQVDLEMWNKLKQPLWTGKFFPL